MDRKSNKRKPTALVLDSEALVEVTSIEFTVADNNSSGNSNNTNNKRMRIRATPQGTLVIEEVTAPGIALQEAKAETKESKCSVCDMSPCGGVTNYAGDTSSAVKCIWCDECPRHTYCEMEHVRKHHIAERIVMLGTNATNITSCRHSDHDVFICPYACYGFESGNTIVFALHIERHTRNLPFIRDPHLTPSISASTTVAGARTSVGSGIAALVNPSVDLSAPGSCSGPDCKYCKSFVEGQAEFNEPIPLSPSVARCSVCRSPKCKQPSLQQASTVVTCMWCAAIPKHYECEMNHAMEHHSAHLEAVWNKHNLENIERNEDFICPHASCRLGIKEEGAFVLHLERHARRFPFVGAPLIPSSH